MTLTGGKTDVRQLLDQTSTTDTQYSEQFIEDLLNEGRRIFARILPEHINPKLRTSGTDTTTAGLVSFPADYLKEAEYPQMYIEPGSADESLADYMGREEAWRLRFLESNTNTASSAANGIFRVRITSGGWKVTPTTIAELQFEYIKEPDALDATDNTELSPEVDDLVVNYAYEKCMGTKRGNIQLAQYLAQQRGYFTSAIAQNSEAGE